MSKHGLQKERCGINSFQGAQYGIEKKEEGRIQYRNNLEKLLRAYKNRSKTLVGSSESMLGDAYNGRIFGSNGSFYSPLQSSSREAYSGSGGGYGQGNFRISYGGSGIGRGYDSSSRMNGTDVFSSKAI